MNSNVDQFNTKQILMYHLLPGVPILVSTVVLYNVGITIMLSIMLSILIALVPTQLVVLKIYSKKHELRFNDFIIINQSMSVKMVIVISLIVFSIAFISYGIATTVEHEIFEYLNDKLFGIPDNFILYKTDFDTIARNIVITVIIMNVFLNGFMAPFVEEIYFRGFLLPRMQELGSKAPLASATLFSLYHLISPYELISRIIAFTPIAYFAWSKNDIRISIISHCLVNFTGACMMAVVVL